MNKAAAAESEKKLLQIRRRSLVERCPYLYVLPATLMFVGLVAYPILWVIGESFRGASGKGFVGFSQYVRAFSDPVFWRVLLNMFYWGAITIPVQMVLGGSIAYLIERHTSRSRTFFRVMFFLPVVTSVSVVSIVWAQMYAPYYGIVQEYLKYIGVQLTIAPLGEPSIAIFALILVNIWQWTGFSMIMYIAGINSIPSELFDAALIDGAHGWNLAIRIVVPLLSPVTRSLLLLGVIGTLQTFPIVHLMTGGGPDHASEIFGTYIFKQGFVIGDSGYSSALSVLALFLALALSVLQIAVLGSRLSPQTRRPAT
jgi:multiple sugar transport system permease protein/raffinose/stachyose/melibiose transport system permease protein